MINALELFQYEFMQRAFLAGLCVAVLAPYVGIYVVAKRYAMLSDTLAHVALAAITLSSILDTMPLITTAICTIVAALCIEKLRSTERFAGEHILSLFLSGSLALAVILISVFKANNLQSALFGSITTVSPMDLWTIVLFSIAIIVFFTLFFPQLLSVIFNEELALIQGVRVRLIQYSIVICAALTITLALRIVGGLLVGALMVIPVLAANQLRISFTKTLFFAILFALLSVCIGLYASAVYAIPSGATIVITTLVFFFLSSLIRYAKNA